jgi:two-component system, NtrC family, sensor kinase
MLRKYWPLPLRFSIPIVLMLFGSLISIFSFQREVQDSNQRVERQLLQEAKSAADYTSGTLEYLFRKSDIEGANLVISKLSANGILQSALLVDENNRIALATQYQFRNRSLQDTEWQTLLPLIQDVQQSLAGQTSLAADRQILRSIYPVTLGAKPGEIRPSKVGALLIEYDLSLVKRRATVNALRRSLESSIILAMLSIAVWILFERLVTQRARLLEKASESLAQGNLAVRTRLLGSDEIARISQAFDHMAERIQFNQQQLKDLADRRALFNQLSAQIRESLDLNQVLDTAVDAIRQLLKIDRCKFLWYQPGSAQGEFKLCCSSTDISRVTQLSYYPIQELPTLRAHFLKSGVLGLDDLEHDQQISEDDRTLLITHGFKALLCTVIHTNSERVGIIICEHFQQDRRWSEDEIDLLKGVTDQLTIAISQAELYESTQLSATTAAAQADQLQSTLEELKQAQTKLIHTEKMSSLGQLVAGVAHEINNPVNFISGNLSHASDYLDRLVCLLDFYQTNYAAESPSAQELSEKIELPYILEDFPKMLSSMKIGTARILEIVLSLRNFSRLDESEFKFVNLHDGLDSTLLMLQHRLKPQYPRPAIHIVKEYGQLPMIGCHAGQLNQVFMNLLSNAIDALEECHEKNPKKYASTAMTIQIATTLIDNHFVRISIADNASGIPEEIRHKLFDPFFTTKEVGKGTGLGLSISYQIVTERHAGQLSCVSELGKGSEFFIDIPINPEMPSER